MGFLCKICYQFNWRYSFDSWTIELDAIEKIGVATNDLSGNSVVYDTILAGSKNIWNRSSESKFDT